MPKNEKGEFVLDDKPIEERYEVGKEPIDLEKSEKEAENTTDE